MERNSLISRKRKKICCCFFAEGSSEDESAIILDQGSIASSTSQINNYAITKYAANKIYFIGNNDFRYIICFRQFIIENKNISSSTIATKKKNIKINSRLKYNLFSRFDEGIKISDSGIDSIPNEKICKKIVKLIISRIEIKNCLVSKSGIGPLSLQLARYTKVIALESDEMNLDILINNSSIYNVSENINTIQGDILNYDLNSTLDLVVLCLNPLNLKSDEDLLISIHLPNLIKEIERSLEICENVMLVFPSNLNPENFCEQLTNLSIYPCIEFFVFFDSMNIKNIVVFLGKIARIEISSIINSILSKLGLNYKQRSLINEIIQKLSLRKVIEILVSVENNYSFSSTIETLWKKANYFFEIIRSQGILLSDIIILYNGIEGDDIHGALKQTNEYFLEYKIEGETMIEINNMQIIGKEAILQYLEEAKRSENSSTNSLMNLIDSAS